MKILSTDRELNLLKTLFFLFGIQIMSWVPRFPEVKANLQLSNGQFGSLLSLGSVGNLTSLIIVGHLVHKFGARQIMRIAALVMALSLSFLTHSTSSLLFFIFIVLQGASISAFHICINTQGFHFQDRTKRQVVTLLSGFWSSGALITSILAGFMVDRVELGTYSNVLAVICLVAMLYIIQQLSPNLVTANTNPDSDHRARDMFKGFKIDRLVSGGLLCSIMLEFSIGDWAAIFVKEDMGIKSGIHTLPYILFTVAMITGRLNLHKLLERYSIHELAVKASLLSGLSFIAGIAAVSIVGTGNKVLVILILSISFTIAGLGSSFLGPSVMNAANTRSKFPSSVVIGQIGVINISLVFAVRWVIAWTAQATSLSIAILIPAVMLLTVPYFAKIFKSA
ncbi:ProP Permeases of the major facilitator superfamily [Candidatus Nanopelagicaceae bacterium]|jgi:MFS family permease